ncbi:hypothetical protein BDN72DRAFT_894340 [Pluteus cervinus]|uniref:Uncharacterized protein n=1 Tax=Pluteus cervinus TaxID=181527 RepID=A0ACD3B4C1_9AGAR|nr:hypothetical protein BDN72DRAFT_894340 [Pluteus cervinus]
MLVFQLPEDLLLAICLHLTPADLLSLKQTCRVLHAFGCMDYVWHQMRVDLPLDLPLHGCPRALAASQLQEVTMKALQLDHNWSQPISRIKQLTQILHGGIVSQMQHLGPNWLVTLSRYTTSTRLCVWCLRKLSKAYKIASFDVLSETIGFSASINSGSGDTAFIALYGTDSSRNESLKIYSTLLEESPREDESSLATPRLLYNTSLSKGQGMFVEVHAYQHIIACTITLIVAPSPVYRVLFINSLTGRHALMDPDLAQYMAQPRYRLYPESIAFAGFSGSTTFVVRTYALPDSITVLVPGNDTVSTGPQTLHIGEPQHYGASLLQHQQCHIPFDFDFHLAAEPLSMPPSHLSTILFHSFSRQRQNGAYAFHFPLEQTVTCLADETDIAIHQFSTSPSASAEIVCMGKTGRRAIWLERRWDTDEFRLMKATFDSSRSGKVDVLLPRHLALPFEPQACNSLEFDEATGRVYLGLHTGELYVLDL